MPIYDFSVVISTQIFITVNIKMCCKFIALMFMRPMFDRPDIFYVLATYEVCTHIIVYSYIKCNH